MLSTIEALESQTQPCHFLQEEGSQLEKTASSKTRGQGAAAPVGVDDIADALKSFELEYTPLHALTLSVSKS